MKIHNMTTQQAIATLLAQLKVGNDFGIIPLGQRAFECDTYTYQQGDLVARAAAGSLDAANALHDAALPGWLYSTGTTPSSDQYACSVWSPDIKYDDVVVGRDSLARTWLIAILQALAHKLAVPDQQRPVMTDDEMLSAGLGHPLIEDLVEASRSALVSLGEAEDKFHVLSSYITDGPARACAQTRAEWMASAAVNLRMTLARLYK